MTVTLEEFMKDFTPMHRAQVEARAADPIKEKLAQRNLRQAQHLTQASSTAKKLGAASARLNLHCA